MATALGARRVDILEPNPMNFMNLLATQLSNENLLKRWCLSNSCISDSNENRFVGPFPKIFSSASSGRTSSDEFDGVEILSLTLSNFRENKRDYSLIKIDIEGAEKFILKDLHLFGVPNFSYSWSCKLGFLSDIICRLLVWQKVPVL